MALTATDITTVVEDRAVEGKKHRNRCQLTLATDGTYPSGGIPLPGREALGMGRNIDYVIITDPDDAVSTIVRYDQDNHKLRLYTASTGAELATTATVGSTVLNTLYVEAVGW